MTKSDCQEAIDTLNCMFDAEALVIANMIMEGEEDVDRRPLRAYAFALQALKKVYETL